MKQLTFILIISFLSISAFSQTVKHPNINADSLRHNSVGLNISPELTILLGGDIYKSNISVLYKHYGDKFNFRFGLSATPEINTNNNYTIYFHDGTKISGNNLYNGETILITDSTVLKRFDLHENYLLELNVGLEKAKKTRIGTWVLGAELNAGYFHKYESYTFREFENTIPIDESIFTEFNYLAPNTSVPYFTGEYIKLGINIITGFEWNLTKRINVSATVSPNISSLIKISEEYRDNENYLEHTDYSGLNMDYGYINFYLSYKF
jgi:hypothetical protein